MTTVWKPINAVECMNCGSIYNADEAGETCKNCGYSPLFKVEEEGEEGGTVEPLAKWQFQIPDMFITREDIALIIYMREYGMDEDEAKEHANEITDEEMKELAEEWSLEFYDGYEGMFAAVLTKIFDYHDANKPYGEK